jgi:hypothetical protein
MAGWSAIKQIRTLEERADLLGMRFAAYKHDDSFGANVALIPKDQDSLPIYTRDAILFAGSLESADQFMQGIAWARDYDRMVVDRNIDTKRIRKEQDLRNKQLVEILKGDGITKKGSLI